MKIKKSLSCARVDTYRIDTSSNETYYPQSGDVAVFRITHEEECYLAGPDWVNRYLFTGDLILATYGNRYATSQMEGYVPQAPGTPLHLIGRGGVVGTLKTVNATYKTEVPTVELVGYAVDMQGQVINTREQNLLPFDPSQVRSKVILSIGSSMDAGKTTTAAYLSAGLQSQGAQVAFIKLTGTTFPKDKRFVRDRGTDYVCDFADLGFPSTFLEDETTLLGIYQTLVDQCWEAVQPEYIVLEIAYGILQRETELLLDNPAFMNTIYDVILSCATSLEVQSALHILDRKGIRPFALAGLFTASELMIQEVARSVEIPIIRLPHLLTQEPLRLLEHQALALARRV